MGSLDFVAPLFVPGNRPERFAKAAASGADAIIIDLEDAVPTDAKELARASLRVDFTTLPVLVRINGFGTTWYADDLVAVSKLPFAAIVFPKMEIAKFSVRSETALVEPAKSHPVVALIETARGVSEARPIAELTSVARIAFGSIDYCADVGCSHTRDALLAARSELVLASRLAGKLPPIDGVTTTLDERQVIVDDSRYARDIGFGGKLCIHPRQVDGILTGFRPDESEIAWSRRVLSSGDGAVSVDGAMVDEPVRRRARSILARSDTRQPADDAVGGSSRSVADDW
jgi:citrate lyase subunit beta / citryl-CoA lyase